MNSVPVDPREAAGRFADAIDSANACLGQVNAEMAALQASWRGEASARFGQAMNDWEQQFDRILGSLTDLLTITGGSAERSDERNWPCRR